MVVAAAAAFVLIFLILGWGELGAGGGPGDLPPRPPRSWGDFCLRSLGAQRHLPGRTREQLPKAGNRSITWELLMAHINRVCARAEALVTCGDPGKGASCDLRGDGGVGLKLARALG